MCRLYVSLKTKEGDRIISSGDSSIIGCLRRYYEILRLLTSGESPTVRYKYKDLIDGVLSIKTRKSKKVRLSIKIPERW